MNKLASLLETNNCDYDSFMDLAHMTLLTFVLEAICKRFKEDSRYKARAYKDYYSTRRDEIVTARLAEEVCGAKLPPEDLQWLNTCIMANLKKSSQRQPVPMKKKRQLLSMQNNRCACCGCCLDIDAAHYDHIIPWDLVGDELENNYQMLCSYCNEHKNASTYYMLKRLIVKNNV